MFGTSLLVVTAVTSAVLAFGLWLVGLLALVTVSRKEIDVRRPRLAARLDRTIWVAWIAGTLVLMGPAFGLTMAAFLVE